MDNAAGLYRQLEMERHQYLERARDGAKLTIPQLMPEEGHGDQRFPTGYQSLGARGVNNLASKLLLALMPPGQPFFRLKADPMFVEQQAQGDPQLKSDLDSALAKVESAVMTKVDSESIRIGIFAALKQLIIAGNTLLYLPDSGGLRVFRLDRYVLKRDPMGNVLRIITKEDLDPRALPGELRATLELSEEDDGKKTVELYTWAERKDNDTWVIQQSVKGEVLVEEEYPQEEMPFIPLRITALDGEDYGSSIVEEVMGDLVSLEQLSKAVVEGARMSARAVMMIRPNSTVDPRELSQATNGGMVTGAPEEVSFLQVGKQADMRVAAETINRLKESLSYAFLLNSAVQRNAERVTATEIRLVAQELEDTLGGVYSVLSQELQLPMVRKLLRRMEDNEEVTKLPEGLVEPVVVTGLDALGRGRELNSLVQALQTAAAVIGPETVAQTLNFDNFLSRVFTGVGVDPAGLVKTPEQLAQESQLAQQQAMIQQLGPEAMRQGGQIIQQQQRGEGEG